MAEPKAKRKLTRERIQDAAFDLIERIGIAEFSQRKLAAELDCEAMSIYYYYPSKAHLLDALIDRVFSELMPLPAPEADWLQRIVLIAREWREAMLLRPAFYPYVAQHKLDTPVCLRWLDEVLGIFRASGLPPEVYARMYRVTWYYVTGAVLDETENEAHGPSSATPMSPDTLVLEHPNVARAAPFFRRNQFERTFNLGLDMLIEGMRETARKYAPQTPPVI